MDRKHQFREDLRDIQITDFRRRFSLIQRDNQRHQAFDNRGVAVTGEPDPPFLILLHDDPDLTLATRYFILRLPLLLSQRR